MSTAVLDVPAVKPAPAVALVPAAARLLVRAVFGVVLLGLLTLVVGPRLYPFDAFYVRTGSMAPAIPVGGLVIATRAAAADLRPGDVIVFQRPDQPGTMVVHRIDAVQQRASGRVFITRGDANAGPDGWEVPASGDGWRAVYSIPRAGFVVGWLDAALSRRGWLGTLAIALAIYALVAIWRAEEPS
ncbi:MAG: signal peptidase I [Actinomycetota bacterium]